LDGKAQTIMIAPTLANNLQIGTIKGHLLAAGAPHKIRMTGLLTVPTRIWSPLLNIIAEVIGD
jgi:hypothetical protein